MNEQPKKKTDIFSFSKTLSQHREIMEKLDKIIKEMEELKKDSYWAYTKEYWVGLLDASIHLVKKIKSDLE